MVQPLKSNRQRREEIKALRASRTARQAMLEAAARRKQLEARGVLVNVSALAPNNSYGTPDFVQRGYYVDRAFRCKTCGKEEVWTATRQKWWYEVAKGFVYSTATLCHACRRKEQARKSDARRIHLEGLARKARQGGKRS
jgi:hypothetical protein